MKSQITRSVVSVKPKVASRAPMSFFGVLRCNTKSLRLLMEERSSKQEQSVRTAVVMET